MLLWITVGINTTNDIYDLLPKQCKNCKHWPMQQSNSRKSSVNVKWLTWMAETYCKVKESINVFNLYRNCVDGTYNK
jgi:hypothetical protein